MFSDILLILLLVTFPCFTKVFHSNLLCVNFEFDVSSVLGSSATGAGIKYLFSPALVLLGCSPFVFRSLPFILGSAGVSIISGFIVSKMGRNRPAIWFGSTLFTIGTGLMTMLDYTSSMYVFFLLEEICYDAQRSIAPNRSFSLWSQLE